MLSGSRATGNKQGEPEAFATFNRILPNCSTTRMPWFAYNGAIKPRRTGPVQDAADRERVLNAPSLAHLRQCGGVVEHRWQLNCHCRVYGTTSANSQA